MSVFVNVIFRLIWYP